MEKLKDNINKAMRSIDKTATLFYQQKNQEGFQELDITLNTLMETINVVMTYQASQNVKLIDDQILNKVLLEAMKAIEHKDTVLIADILTYEVNEMLMQYLN
jgi:hypothetical protein